MKRVFIRLLIVFVIAWVAIFGVRYKLAADAREDAASAVAIANITHRVYEDAHLSDTGQPATSEQEDLERSTKADADELFCY